MVAGSSVDSSLCSVIDNKDPNGCGGDYTDLYSQSVMVSGMVKEPEDLIDRDLINLLKYIREMKIPEKPLSIVEFGDITRYKTLIFDLDETLIHSTLLKEGSNVKTDPD